MTRPACPTCHHPTDLHTGYGQCADCPQHECNGVTIAMVRDARDNLSTPTR